MGRIRGSVASDSRRARLSRLLARMPSDDTTRLSYAEILARYRGAYPDDAGKHGSLTSALGALVHAGELRRERGIGAASSVRPAGVDVGEYEWGRARARGRGHRRGAPQGISASVVDFGYRGRFASPGALAKPLQRAPPAVAHAITGVTGEPGGLGSHPPRIAPR